MTAAPNWLRYSFPSVCVALGGWQLYRWRRKEDMIARYLADIHAPPIELHALDMIHSDAPRRYTLHNLEREFEGNMVKWIGPRGRGKGYAYLAIGRHTLDDGHAVLLNLGWHDNPVRIELADSTCFIKDDVAEERSWINPQIPVKNIKQLASELNCEPVMLKVVSERDTEKAPYSNKHVEYVLTWWSLAAFSYLFGRFKK